MRVIDAHCHLEQDDYPELAPLINRALAAGVVHAIVVGQLQRPGDFGNALQLAQARPDFFTPTVGIHPHEAQNATEDDFRQLSELCARPEVKAVGEAGLDYYYDRSPRQLQQDVFRRQCELARALGKPLVVHVRDAHEDCHRILSETRPGKVMIHCFTGDLAAARGYLDLGCSLSVSGVVTYKKTEGLQEAVRFAPLDRLMVETDSPYLAPVPNRGKKNEPGWVVEVLRKVAELKGVPVEEAAEATVKNTVAFFGLALR